MSIAIQTTQAHVEWRARFLLTLVERELASRYRGAVFGWLWPILVQVSQLLVFTYLFSAIFHVRAPLGPDLPTGPLAYGLWLFTALAAWNALQIGVMSASSAILGQPNLVKRVVFPLALLPLVPVLAALVEACAGFAVLLALVAITTRTLPPTVALIPVVLIVQFIFTAGLAYFAAALTTFVRDVPQTLGPLFLLTFYLTPIVYPIAAVPARFRIVAYYNPFRVLVDAYRSLVFGGPLPFGPGFLATTLLALATFYCGWSFFKRLRPSFADVI